MLEDDTFATPWEHYEGLGFGDEVPTYLRYTGKLQLLSLTKWETETAVNEIWAAKELADAERAPKEETFGYAHEPFDASEEAHRTVADFYEDFIVVRLL